MPCRKSNGRRLSAKPWYIVAHSMSSRPRPTTDAPISATQSPSTVSATSVRMIASQRTGSAAADLYVALTRARSEAVKRDTDVVLAPTVAGQWQQGWFIANPGLAGANLDVHRAMGNVTITGPAKVTYHANGRLGGGAIVSFDISASGVADHRCVSVDLSGRPYQKASGC